MSHGMMVGQLLTLAMALIMVAGTVPMQPHGAVSVDGMHQVDNDAQELKQSPHHQHRHITNAHPHSTAHREHRKGATWESSLGHIKAHTSAEIQTEAVRSLLQRLLQDRAADISVTLDPSLGPKGRDTFRVVSMGVLGSTSGGVEVVGSSGVAAAWGVHHYLKYYCHAHISWEANQLSLPRVWPKAHIKITSNDRFRYYQNVCTVSYSMAWWDWQRWEREIDWMALNGINLPLAFTAQEAIWRRVYGSLGLTAEELNQHFVGPAFFAWGRMGNIRGWGGPLPESWHNKTLLLQHQILKRMRELGMTPVLPAFAGHVPQALTRLYPNASISQLGNWGHFLNEEYCCTSLLDPKDPLFQTIGSMFIKEMSREYNGTDHVYNCDTFNEMTPSSNSTEYLRSIGKAVYSAMTHGDPKAVWVMQGWLFFNRPQFWQPDQAKALLTSVPIGSMIVLDLAAEYAPQYLKYDSFYGQPFIFCMLHNYGGVNGLFGAVDSLLKNLAAARTYPNVSMVGTGLTPEGINQNYVMYDLMNEQAWRKGPLDIGNWVGGYAQRRYGSDDLRLATAWGRLMRSVYNCTAKIRFHGRHAITRRPNMHVKLLPNDFEDHTPVKPTCSNHGQYIIVTRPRLPSKRDPEWYSINDVLSAWDLMMEVASEKPIGQGRLPSGRVDVNQNRIVIPKASQRSHTNTVAEQPTFQHDLVDVTRQVLQILGGHVIINIQTAFRNKVELAVEVLGLVLEDLLEDLDTLLGSSPDFLLGTWMDQAQQWATNEKERELYLSNALNQITLWGPDGEIHDYAIKQWNGVVGGYLKPRWTLFVSHLLASLREDRPYNQTVFESEVFTLVEDPFSRATNASYPTSPEGDAVSLALAFHQKYRGAFRSEGFMKIHRPEESASWWENEDLFMDDVNHFGSYEEMDVEDLELTKLQSLQDQETELAEYGQDLHNQVLDQDKTIMGQELPTMEDVYTFLSSLPTPRRLT